METLTSPPQFLASMGYLALEVRLLVMKLMPIVMMLTFIWGYLSFLFGMSKDKLDLKKYLFTPLFLLLLVIYYPLFIDITGGLYGTVIRAFDRPESKEFIAEYTGLKEELAGYERAARVEIENTPAAYRQKLQSMKKEQEPIDDPALYEAYEKAKQEIESNITKAENLQSSGVVKGLDSIWKFFEISAVRIIRVIIDLIRNVFVSLLVIFGCFAIFFESIPVFRGILSKWFKFYTATTFWALTVSILDHVFLAFAKAGVASGKYFKDNKENIFNTYINEGMANASLTGNYSAGYYKDVTDFGINWLSYGGSEGLNTAVCVVLVLCYCMVPYITSLYVGGENAGMFMSKVVGVGSMAVKQAMSTATSGVGSVVKATSGDQSKGEMAKLGASVASLAATLGAGNK